MDRCRDGVKSTIGVRSDILRKDAREQYPKDHETDKAFL
jgi:hypothetical protein